MDSKNEVLGSDPPFKLSPGHEISVSVKWRLFWIIKKRIRSHTHPSILVLPHKSPYRYIMALTPYPKSNDKYEHPSIVFSNDLIMWSEDEVHNPIAYNPYHYNADPHLTYDPINKRIMIYYIRLLGGSGTTRYNTVFAKFSHNGVNWSKESQILPPTLPGELYISPAVEYDKNNGFLMWIVHYNLRTLEKKVLMYRSNDGLDWKFVEECNISQIYSDQSWNVWHLSVRRVRNKYWMIAAMNPLGKLNGDSPIYLFFFESYDGLNWKGYSEPILTPGEVGAEKLYRADFFVYNGVIHVIYSWMTQDRDWHISYTYMDTGDSSLISSNVIEYF